MSGGMMMNGGDFGWWFPASIAGGLVVIIGGAVWFEVGQTHDIEARQARAYATAQFRPGEMVRSRVGGFRGIVTASSCWDSCRYLVRFPVASMEPKWVSEVEIETAVPK